MKPTAETSLRQRIRRWIIFFIFFLVLSGITAFPIETELQWLTANDYALPKLMQQWLNTVYNAVKNTNEKYPFLAYGTDWLAFAHLVIAVAFIGPLRHPVRNIWVVQCGMVACVMVMPLALIAGQFRHIPIYWRLLDCSFGIIGLVPLSLCLRDINKLRQHRQEKLSGE